MTPDLAARSLAFLDWPDLLGQLSAFARSGRGAEVCRSLPFAPSLSEARHQMSLVTEMTGLIRPKAPGAPLGELPGLAFAEIEPLLNGAEKGMSLGAEELQLVAGVCEISSAVRRYFENKGEDRGDGTVPAPKLWDLASTLEPREEIAHRVRSTFDTSGQIRDSVSPDLARLRGERDTLSTRVRDEIESLMKSDEFAPHLQDEFVTMRQDRYVLPLKASSKSMGLGIVHDESRTGETVFVEPTVVVGLNNRLKVAELSINRETRRILEEIAKRVAEAAPAIRRNLETLTAIDVIAAKARLSVSTDSLPVDLVDEARIDLRQVRHPLLALRLERVVANDLALGEKGQARVLVISGPNAGGKTILLKSVGMAALLARAGLHVPCQPGSVVGFFQPVLADIGDQQSLAGGLSTFSAHLANVSGILAAAGEDKARPMVLVDELMVGTNPDQGAALARALLEALADLPGLVVTTTHYDSLKTLAQSDDRFRNGAMEYDLEKLAPSYRLRDGVPGRSYAFDIATRMGLPAGVIARANVLAGASTIGLEDVIARLEARESSLAVEADALAKARVEIETTAGDQRAAAESLRAREKELARESRKAIEEAVRDAREAIRAIVREAQNAGSARAAEMARRAVEATARAATADLPKEPPPPGEPAKIAMGALVFVPSLKSDGVVVKMPDARGRVKVAIGALNFDIDAAELRVPKTPPPAKSKYANSANAPLTGAGDSNEYTTPTKSNTIDLRGLRAEEAVQEVELYLDKAALEGKSPVFILHGHGTGALKKAVREYLARSPYVRKWRPGEKTQGGDGVSIIDL